MAGSLWNFFKKNLANEKKKIFKNGVDSEQGHSTKEIQ